MPRLESFAPKRPQGRNDDMSTKKLQYERLSMNIRRETIKANSLECANRRAWKIAHLPSSFPPDEDVMCDGTLSDFGRLKLTGRFSDIVLGDFLAGTSLVLSMLNNGMTLPDMQETRKIFAIWGRHTDYSVSVVAAKERINGRPVVYIQMRCKKSNQTLECCAQLTRVGLRGIHAYERIRKIDGAAHLFYGVHGPMIERRVTCGTDHFGAFTGTNGP